jgi:hypothetical protein
MSRIAPRFGSSVYLYGGANKLEYNCLMANYNPNPHPTPAYGLNVSVHSANSVMRLLEWNWWGNANGPINKNSGNYTPNPTRDSVNALDYSPYRTAAPADCVAPPPTYTYTPSVTPTRTNTATFTPSRTPTATASLTPSITPIPCSDTNLTLIGLGIELVDGWSPNDEAAILTGAIQTARALCQQGAAITNLDSFREIMQGKDASNQWRRIKFSRINNPTKVCITAKTNDGLEYSANIQCRYDVNLTEFTVVHEFGHVFVGRTTVGGNSSYLSMIINPNGPSGGPLRDLAPTPVVVMGFSSYNLVIGSNLSDWQRSNLVSDNGWGSAAQWQQGTYYIYDFPPPPNPTPTPFPLWVPKIGPCGEGAPSDLPAFLETPFPYQQNPCTFPDWVAVNITGAITEREEGAADMFLNWVYWKNHGNSTAFSNKLWRSSTCYPNGCPDDIGLSGQVRGVWMNQTMTALFNQFGW